MKARDAKAILAPLAIPQGRTFEALSLLIILEVQLIGLKGFAKMVDQEKHISRHKLSSQKAARTFLAPSKSVRQALRIPRDGGQPFQAIMGTDSTASWVPLG